MRRSAPLLALACASLLALTPAGAQRPSPRLPERAIRGDIPMTNAIRRAFDAGTRDSTGRPGRNYWQLRADYAIQARLDTATSRITGSESIVIHNTSPDSLRELTLRLDWNVFRGQAPRAPGWVVGEVTDGIDITRMTIDGQPVALPTAGGPPASAPMLVNGTSTVATVRLARAIPARGRATLTIDWNAKVPGGRGSGHRSWQRFGDTLYQPTQWFPRLAKYDDLRGWNTDPYLGPSEFFNNFGRYDVRLDVPAGWVVSATGTLQNEGELLTDETRARLGRVLTTDSITTIVGPGETGTRAARGSGRAVWHFVADTVNDFAWATARSFVWQGTRATIPTKGPVPIHMYYLSGNAARWREVGPVTRHALEFYSLLWFPYQFPKLAVQDGPSLGMEYPMVINSDIGAADHEAAHQWWPMVVGNNETFYGWMDEGFNQYMNILSDADARAQPGARTRADLVQYQARLDNVGRSYGRVSGSETEAPMMWNANFGGSGYGYQTYSKTPPMLSMLGGIVGDTAVWRAHREFATAWMFKHPSPWDYMFSMSRSLNRDLGWFWYHWLFSTEAVHGSIVSVNTTGASTAVVVRQSGQMPAPVVLKLEFAPTGAAIRLPAWGRMVDSTTAVLTYPVDLWFSGDRNLRIAINVGGRAIRRITLDPDGRFPDGDITDNVWPRAGGAGAGR